MERGVIAALGPTLSRTASRSRATRRAGVARWPAAVSGTGRAGGSPRRGYGPSARARRAAPEKAGRVAGHGTEERAAPQPGRHQRTEERHRVDAGAALALPIDVLQVEPQRELVQREGGSHAVESGGDPAQAARSPVG